MFDFKITRNSSSLLEDPWLHEIRITSNDHHTILIVHVLCKFLLGNVKLGLNVFIFVILPKDDITKITQRI